VVTHDITAAAVADHLWLMGRDHDAKGNPLPGSHIVETYDLIERDLCWHPQIITQPKFMEFVREIKRPLPQPSAASRYASPPGERVTAGRWYRADTLSDLR